MTMTTPPAASDRSTIHVRPSTLVDVVDAFLDPVDRIAGCVLALVVDENDDLVAPLLVDDVPGDATAVDVHRLVSGLVDIASHFQRRPALGLGVGAGAGAVLPVPAGVWADALAEACTGTVVRPLGVVLATPQDLRRVDDDAAAA